MTVLPDLTGRIGVDRAIDAVGVDANMPEGGPTAKSTRPLKEDFERELKRVAPEVRPNNGNRHPGSGPSQVLIWATAALAKAGTLSIVGIYPQSVQFFPIGSPMNRSPALLSLILSNYEEFL